MLNFKLLLLYPLIFLTSSLALSEPSILEYNNVGLPDHHLLNIESILCPKENCSYFLINDFFGQEFDRAAMIITQQSPEVVNMSFTLQHGTKPQLGLNTNSETYHKELKEFEENEAKLSKSINKLKDLILNNDRTMFAIAAGNGMKISFMQSRGIAVGEENILYPAIFENHNTIKVAAADSSIIRFNKLNQYTIADYSNYSLEDVDVMAPVPRGPHNERLQGTSYATPFVAKIYSQINNLDNDSSLTPLEIKEILLKSCFVKNINQAIAASKDLLANGKQSTTYQAMYNRKRRVREKLQKQIGDIILVKCGGLLIPDIAMKCANTYLRSNKSVSISESCVDAHQKVLDQQSNDPEALNKLWKIRNI